MAPSRNSTLVTKPPTRARTCTSSHRLEPPVNSSQSVTVRLTGWATVPAVARRRGGGGLSPQPDSMTASKTASGLRFKNPSG
jgi:hypothetical protein